jgi:hypothetical protein
VKRFSPKAKMTGQSPWMGVPEGRSVSPQRPDANAQTQTEPQAQTEIRAEVGEQAQNEGDQKRSKLKNLSNK